MKTDALDFLSFEMTPPLDDEGSQFSIYFKLEDNHKRSPMTADFVANFKVTQSEASEQSSGWTQTETKIAGKEQ